MNGAIVLEPILISGESSHLLAITSTGSAKVILTSSGNVQTTITNTPNVHVTNTPSVIVTSSGIIQTSISNTPNVHVTNIPNVIVTSSGIVSAQQSGTWNITNITGTISLPTGAATSTGQATTNSKLDTIDTDIKASQPRKLQDGLGNAITSTSTGLSKRSLDVAIAGTAQVVVTSSGAVVANQGSPNTNTNGWPIKVTNGTTVVGVSTNAEIRSSDTVNNGGTQGAVTVGTSAVEAKVGASKLTNRKLLTIFHNGNGTLYWGYSNAVTTANGTQIFKNTMLALPVGDGTSIWLISGTAGQDIRVTEGA